MTLFFDHILSSADILTELDRDDLAVEDREELVQIIDELLLHHTLNVLLSHIPKTAHESFTQQLLADPTDPSLLELAQKYTEIDIVSAITTHGGKIKAEILTEIKKARR